MNPFDALKALRDRRQQAAAQEHADARLKSAQIAARGLHDDNLLDRVLDLPDEFAQAQAEKNEQVLGDLQREALALFAEVQRRGLLASVTPPVPSVAAVAPVVPPPVAARPALTREQVLELELAEVRAGMTTSKVEQFCSTLAGTQPARRTEAHLSAQFDKAVSQNIEERFQHQKGR